MNIRNISIAEVELLKNFFQEFTFPEDFQLIYEHHIPNLAIVLIEGIVELNKKKKEQHVAQPGMAVGLTNLVKDIPFKFNCRIKGQSTVLLLPKSDILRILKDKKSPAYPVLSPLVS